MSEFKARHPIVVSALYKTVSTTFFAPLGVATLRLQCQGELKDHTPYKGTFSIFSRIIKEEGFRKLYKGNTIDVSKLLLAGAADFCFGLLFKRIFFVDPKSTGYWKAFILTNVSDLAVDTCTYTLIYPVDFVHTRYVNDIGKKKFNGIKDIYTQIKTKEGLRGLYRGFLAGFLGILLVHVTYTGLNELGSKFFSEAMRKRPILRKLLEFGVSMISGLAVYPFNVIRRRMIMTAGEEEKYDGVADCKRKIVEKEGVRGLFSGVGVSLAVGAVTMGVVAIVAVALKLRR